MVAPTAGQTPESEARADFSSVPVVEVDRTNLASHRAGLARLLQEASFIALDCELSGLGDRKKLNAPSIEDRYKNTGLVAKTRSVISLGVSAFRHLAPGEGGRSWSYRVATYNILVLCGEDYIVEPASLRFLVDHGFDFQAQYSRGVPYLRGNDREEKEAELQPLREVFSLLVAARKPVVLHNGLIDLVFLYHNFWAALPLQLGTFVADLAEMFPAGIYDTKYIADFVSRTQASYLEFVFRKEQRCNAEKQAAGRPHVRLCWEEVGEVSWRGCGLEEPGGEEEGREVCFSYAHHGHCPEGQACSKSHHIDSILKAKNLEQEKKRRKRKHGKTETEGEEVAAKEAEVEVAVPPSDPGEKAESRAVSGGHRAGYDAFMTAFSFSTFLVHQTKLPPSPRDFRAENILSQALVNKVYLVSKDFPLLVQKSTFSKCSVQHDLKMKKLGLNAGSDNEKSDDT